MHVYAKNKKTLVNQLTKAKKGQKKNNAGGYSFKLDKWNRLNRFLILGSEGGSYYTSEKKLTKANAKAVLKCIAEDGVRVVETVVDVSHSGRAAKNDPAIFVLALCSAHGDVATKHAVRENFNKVIRIGTHLFTFLENVKNLRGFGKSLTKTIAEWYNSRSPEKLSVQLVKYRNRNGWTHRDALRVSHPKSVRNNSLYKWVTGHGEAPYEYISAFEEASVSDNVDRVVDLIEDYNLPREAINNNLLKDRKIWEAMLPNMGLTAMIRNLANMTRYGVLEPLNSNTKIVVNKITNHEELKKSRIHPLSVLTALLAYDNSGYVGYYGDKTAKGYNPIPQINDALEKAYYASFDNVLPTGKNWLLGVDVSGSMTMGQVAGIAGLTPNVAAAAMAMVTARTESNYYIHGFAGDFVDLGISASDSLKTVVKNTQSSSFGRTDCALPMLYALDNKLDVDVFVVYTDNETWAGHMHPHEALNCYRDKTGNDAKLIVVGMVANQFTIADPEDAGMLDIAGFDSAAPTIMNEFALGNL